MVKDIEMSNSNEMCSGTVFTFSVFFYINYFLIDKKRNFCRIMF